MAKRYKKEELTIELTGKEIVEIVARRFGIEYSDYMADYNAGWEFHICFGKSGCRGVIRLDDIAIQLILAEEFSVCEVEKIHFFEAFDEEETIVEICTSFSKVEIKD